MTAAPLPALQEILAQTRVVCLPMRVPFRGVQIRQTALIQGPYGWGEFAPFTEYDPQESAPWLAAALESAYQPPLPLLRQTIPLNATLPAVPAGQVHKVLASYRGPIQEIKVKVAQTGLPFDESLAQDYARLAATRQLLPQARIKIDANGGWTLPQAYQALEKLSDLGLLYAEQPVASLTDLAQLREDLRAAGNPLLIAADESVRKASDPLKVARLGAADLMIIKLAPLGGLRRSLALVEEAGLPVVVSSALESSVGIAAGARLAASLPDLPFACGLGTVSLMAQDVSFQPLVAQAGQLEVRQVEPDPQLLDQLAAPKELRRWWLERISACYRLLEAGQDE